jgi:hypothetical protein
MAEAFVPRPDGQAGDPVNTAVEMFFEQAQAEATIVDGVVLPGGKVTITASAKSLYERAASKQTMFFRGGTVHKIVDGKLEILTPVTARSAFEQYAQFWVWRVGRNGKEVLKETVMPQETAAAILACDEARKSLPVITGLCGCPIIFGDGAIVGRGFHQPTGLFITAGEMPIDMELQDAVELLQELVSEFAFQSPGDRSRALAAFITPAMKLGGHLKKFVPADVAEADQSQSGKTYRQRLIAAVYNENPSLVTCRSSGGVGSMDESLAAQLIAGRPFIQFDNFRGRFDSPHAEALLTAEKSFPARVPFKPEVSIDPSRFFVMLSSNGVDTTRDFANRCSIVRNRKREGYKFKTYEEGDLLERVRAKQPEYLGAVFTVIKEWIGQGRNKTNDTRHDFREWAQTLDWIVRNILKEAPLMEGHEEAQVRVSNPDQTFLRQLAIAVGENNRTGEQLIASMLYEIAESAGVAVPGLREPEAEAGKRVIGSIMGRLFKSGDTVTIDEFTVKREEFDVPTPGGGGFKSKRYEFTKLPEPPVEEPLELAPF